MVSSIIISVFAFVGPDSSTIAGIAVMVVLLLLSGLISASEVAFYSLTPTEIEKLKKSKKTKAKTALKLLSNPEKLLATILISNNTVNVAFIILSVWVSNSLFDFKNDAALQWIIQGLVVTIVLLFFGEIMPKVYASRQRLPVINLMTLPLNVISAVFSPITYVLVRSTSVMNRRLKKKNGFTMNELSYAIDLASDELQEEEKILKGIVNFSNIFVKEIMQPRLDVVSVDLKAPFSKITSVIVESGFSRIPVVSGDLDHVQGVLYIKDLLPHIHKPDFKWQSLVRPPFYVPETKRINDLMTDFKTRKIHMAIVVDEYGGSSGIVTLEDILEEIVGDITDEFDNDDLGFVKIDDNTWLFEAKTQLMDFYRVFDIEDDIFENERGETDSLGGLILEKTGRIPAKNEKIEIGNFTFKIKSVDTRRIKQIFVSLRIKHNKDEE